MSMKRIRYLGTAPGQGERVRIGGQLFVRGEVYSLPRAQARALLARGGFETVDLKNPKIKED